MPERSELFSYPPRIIEFTKEFSPRAAIPVWENDAPARPGFSPMLLYTHHRPEQFRREILPSREVSAARRMLPCLIPLALLLAPQYHAPPLEALLQKQSPYGAAASALPKKIFSARAQVLSNLPERADNVAAILAASFANHAQSARDASSSALQLSRRHPRRRALDARASYPGFQSRRHPLHALAHPRCTKFAL